MTIEEIPRLSTEEVFVPMAPDVSLGAPADIHTDNVWMTFVADGSAIADNPTWYTSSWVQQSTGARLWHAACLIGPAGLVQLNRGDYWPYVKFTHAGETIVRRALSPIRVT